MMLFRDECDSDCAYNLVQISGQRPRPGSKKEIYMERKVKRMLTIFREVRGNVHKEFNLPGKAVNFA
jgi:hypothetical protein